MCVLVPFAAEAAACTRNTTLHQGGLQIQHAPCVVSTAMEVTDAAALRSHQTCLANLGAIAMDVDPPPPVPWLTKSNDIEEGHLHSKSQPPPRAGEDDDLHQLQWGWERPPPLVALSFESPPPGCYGGRLTPRHQIWQREPTAAILAISVRCVDVWLW
jgi:hypothetical protein